MAKTKTHFSTQQDERCCYCEIDRWPNIDRNSLTQMERILMLTSSHKIHLNRYPKINKEYIYAIEIESKKMCYLCYNLLLKLENYYDKEMNYIIIEDFEDSKEIIQKMLSARNTVYECMISKTRYFTPEKIKEIKAYKNIIEETPEEWHKIREIGWAKYETKV